jgi:hypothetical protein
MEGERDVLGMWFQETEGAKFWMQVLTNLRTAASETSSSAAWTGLGCFPEAIEAIFPKTTVQTCIVHLIRASLRYGTSALRDTPTLSGSCSQPVRVAHSLSGTSPEHCAKHNSERQVSMGSRLSPSSRRTARSPPAPCPRCTPSAIRSHYALCSLGRASTRSRSCSDIATPPSPRSSTSTRSPTRAAGTSAVTHGRRVRRRSPSERGRLSGFQMASISRAMDRKPSCHRSANARIAGTSREPTRGLEPRTPSLRVEERRFRMFAAGSFLACSEPDLVCQAAPRLRLYPDVPLPNHCPRSTRSRRSRRLSAACGCTSWRRSARQRRADARRV